MGLSEMGWGHSETGTGLSVTYRNRSERFQISEATSKLVFQFQKRYMCGILEYR